MDAIDIGCQGITVSEFPLLFKSQQLVVLVEL